MIDFGFFLFEDKVFIEDDGDRITIKEYFRKEEIGKIILTVIYEPCEYELKDDFNEDFCNDLFKDDMIFKIEHIEGDDDYNNLGVGKKLMKNAIYYVKKQKKSQIYLNASPIGFSGLQIKELINFYKKFGFKVIKDQGHNALMLLNM